MSDYAEDAPLSFPKGASVFGNCAACGTRIYGAKDATAKTLVNTSGKAFALEAGLGRKKREVFRVLMLDARLALLGRVTVGIGTVGECTVYPREVFRPAIKANAASIVVAHNHPSGDHAPSPQDVALTKQLVDLGRALGVPVIDHLVISRNGYFSFRQSADWPRYA